MTDTANKDDTLEVALPCHWLPAIFNDDFDAMDEEDTVALCRWKRDTRREFGDFIVADLGEDEFFARYHDAADYGVLACMCRDVTLFFPKPLDR